MRQIVETSLGALLGAETYSDVHRVIASVGEALGYPFYGYQYWPGSEEYGDRNFAGLVQCNYPQSWLSRYVEQKYYDIDPVRLFGLAQEGVVEWHQLASLDPLQQRFMKEAAQFGLEDGVIGSFHDSEGGRLQLAYACAAGTVDPAPGVEALHIAGPLMTVCLRKASHLESRIRWLTERQRDSLYQVRASANRERFANS